MGRLHRVVIEGFVHVTMRVISGELLFRDGKDAARLLLIAGDVFERDPVDVEAYCLMPNHYHLLVRDRTGQASASMRDLNGRYARAFNRRHCRRGPLFDRRFHATPVGDDAHAIDCLPISH
jgi:putative transposase